MRRTTWCCWEEVAGARIFFAIEIKYFGIRSGVAFDFSRTSLKRRYTHTAMENGSGARSFFVKNGGGAANGGGVLPPWSMADRGTRMPLNHACPYPYGSRIVNCSKFCTRGFAEGMRRDTKTMTARRRHTTLAAHRILLCNKREVGSSNGIFTKIEPLHTVNV